MAHSCNPNAKEIEQESPWGWWHSLSTNHWWAQNSMRDSVELRKTPYIKLWLPHTHTDIHRHTHTHIHVCTHTKMHTHKILSTNLQVNDLVTPTKKLQRKSLIPGRAKLLTFSSSQGKERAKQERWRRCGTQSSLSDWIEWGLPRRHTSECTCDDVPREV